ncbi:protein phosphatase 2C domain-containing protein [Brachybacterium sp. GCM10030268]|uniref:protein phosphatase 2C domain-containing protein n=1 Tax=Brachybacterium sp. GCM10030268 TaxID=3273382 RepID=UPI00360D6DCF
MRTTLVTDPAVPGANEDAAGVLGDVAVVLDGAGLPRRFRAGCHHSVAWFSHRLAAHLLTGAQDPGTDLTGALARAIAEVRGLHEDECDLEAGSPSATVVAVRRTGEHLEHLVLCDSSLLLHARNGGVRRLSDLRVDDVAREESAPEWVEERRNATGGFWVARHEPEAAEQALTGRTLLTDLSAVHLVSDGITRTVDLLGMHDDDSLSAALSTAPGELIAGLRAAEETLPEHRRPRKLHDDATVLTLSL